MGKRYAILGAGGSFGIHTALYLLEHADPKKVIGIGRNPLRPEPFSLNIEKRPKYAYHAYHITYAHDSAVQCLLSRATAPPGDPQGGGVRVDGTQAAVAGRRPRREVLHSCPRSGARHSSGSREGPARHHL